MVLFGAQHGESELAAQLALLLQERGLGGRGEDLEARLARWQVDRGARAEASRKLAGRWAKLAKGLVSCGGAASPPPGIILAAGRPGFVAKKRDASGEQWLSASGRGFALDPASPLARAEYLAIGDAQGQAKGARITAAAAIDPLNIDRWLGDRIARRKLLRWTGQRVEARQEKLIGAISLSSGPDPEPNEQAIVDILVDKALENPAKLLPADLLARARFAGLEAFSGEALAASAQGWLAPLLVGRRDLDVPRDKLVEALLAALDWNARQDLDKRAPRQFTSPAGSTHAIDYAGDDAPSVEVRAQALFGLDQHPMIGRGEAAVPLLLKLTSPAGRPIQSTRDLPGFWRGSWSDVRKDMKGRYPKHRWPDEPWTETPSLKTKNAFNRGQS